MHFSVLHVLDTLALCSSKPIDEHDGIYMRSIHIWFANL
jgi:hypothetical protein